MPGIDVRMMSYGERVPAQVKTIKNGKENVGTLEINDDYES